MPSSGVLGNREWSGNTPRAPMPKSTSLLQLSSGPNDGRCAEPPAGRAAARWATTDSGRVVNKRAPRTARSEEHTSELQSPDHLACRLLLEKKNGNSSPT